MQYLATEQTDFKTSGNHFKTLFIQLRNILPKFEDFTQIRASVITNWIKVHGLRKAQYLAGHRYISSTENYLANDFESLQNDLENFHPLN
jgi:integrase/recombinase XerD